NGGGDWSEIEKTDRMSGLLAKELADDDVAAGTDQRPLSAQSSPISRAQEIARWRKVALLAHAKNDRHEHENDSRLVDEHGTSRGQPEYCGLKKKLIASGCSEQASTDHLSCAGADQGCAENKHRRDHDDGHAAKTG